MSRCGKSLRSHKTRSAEAKARPARDPEPIELTAKMIKEAGPLTARYHLVVEPKSEGFRCRCLEFPMVAVTGATADEGIAKLRQALAVTIAALMAAGEPLPPPAALLKREAQLNLRVTSEEKNKLETVARQKGFGSVSDFVRSAALLVADKPELLSA